MHPSSPVSQPLRAPRRRQRRRGSHQQARSAPWRALLMLSSVAMYISKAAHRVQGTPLVTPGSDPEDPATRVSRAISEPALLGAGEGEQQQQHRELIKDRLEVPGAGVALVQGDEAAPPVLVSNAVSLDQFATPEESTILFLHVFKCAGTSLRQVLLNWARSEGWMAEEVKECRYGKFHARNTREVCLDANNDLWDPRHDRWRVAGLKLIAGHFFWGFRQYVTPPYLTVTTLRSPLELFVSAQQYMHREQTKTLGEATQWVSKVMHERLNWSQPVDIGFIRRFLNDGKSAEFHHSWGGVSRDEAYSAAEVAVDRLNTCWVVGVVEQYQGFIEVLKYSLDPQGDHPRLWEVAHKIKDNGSPVHSGDVLKNIDPDLVDRFNSTTLGLQWQVYGVALDLWDARCREVLPPEVHGKFCDIPR